MIERKLAAVQPEAPQEPLPQLPENLLQPGVCLMVSSDEEEMAEPVRRQPMSVRVFGQPTELGDIPLGDEEYVIEVVPVHGGWRGFEEFSMFVAVQGTEDKLYAEIESTSRGDFVNPDCPWSGYFVTFFEKPDEVTIARWRRAA